MRHVSIVTIIIAGLSTGIVRSQVPTGGSPTLAAGNATTDSGMAKDIIPSIGVTDGGHTWMNVWYYLTETLHLYFK